MSIFDKSQIKWTEEERKEINNPLVCELELFCSSTNTNHNFLVIPQTYEMYREYMVTLAKQNTKDLSEILIAICLEVIVYPICDKDDFIEMKVPPMFLAGLTNEVSKLYEPSLISRNFEPDLFKVTDKEMRNTLDKIRKTKRFAYWYKSDNENGLACNFIMTKLSSSDRVDIMDEIVKNTDKIFNDVFGTYTDPIKKKVRSTILPVYMSAIPLIDANTFGEEFEDSETNSKLFEDAAVFNDLIMLSNHNFSLDDAIANVYKRNIHYSDAPINELPYPIVGDAFNELRKDLKLVKRSDIEILSERVKLKISPDILEKLTEDEFKSLISISYTENAFE